MPICLPNQNLKTSCREYSAIFRGIQICHYRKRGKRSFSDSSKRKKLADPTFLFYQIDPFFTPMLSEKYFLFKHQQSIIYLNANLLNNFSLSRSSLPKTDTKNIFRFFQLVFLFHQCF